MLRFRNESGEYLLEAFYFIDDWCRIKIDGDEIIVSKPNKALENFIESTIGGRARYYSKPDFQSQRMSIVEI